MSTAKCILHGTAPATPLAMDGSLNRPAAGFDTWEGTFLTTPTNLVNTGDPVNPPGYGTSNLWCADTTLSTMDDGSGVVEVGVRAEGFLLHTQSYRYRSETVNYVKHYGTHTWMAAMQGVRVWSVDAFDMQTKLGRCVPGYYPDYPTVTPPSWESVVGWYLMEARGRYLAEGVWLNECLYTKYRIPTET